MELSVVYSRALLGIEAPLVAVETHLSNGLPAFHIVGLPETAVREAKDRVRSAILNSHFTFPDRRITVNLAPADLPKSGGRFDLAIALGILCASGQLTKERMGGHEFLGELALDGGLRAVPGVIAAAQATRKATRKLVLADASAAGAALAPDSIALPAPDLLTVCAHLNGTVELAAAEPTPVPAIPEGPDLADVIGQSGARRALEIAAAGNHNLLFWGPPGTGKTLLASRLPGILPPPTTEEILTAMALRDTGAMSSVIQPLAGRPFRSPHHSASAAALVGGGSRPVPGEISLAHGGVLFLDELPEFNRTCLEALREPLESGEITLSRAHHKVTYPAQFQLVAAMNPCPCGHLGDPGQHCRCTPDQVSRYRGRVSGPLLDRIDMHVQVSRIPATDLLQNRPNAEDSATVRARVSAAQLCQISRQQTLNAQLPDARLASTCLLEESDKSMLVAAAETMRLSGRAIHRTLKLARTIADLAHEERIGAPHIHEALGYRGDELSPAAT